MTTIGRWEVAYSPTYRLHVGVASASGYVFIVAMEHDGDLHSLQVRRQSGLKRSMVFGWYLATEDPPGQIKAWLVENFEYNLWWTRAGALSPMEQIASVRDATVGYLAIGPSSIGEGAMWEAAYSPTYRLHVGVSQTSSGEYSVLVAIAHDGSLHSLRVQRMSSPSGSGIGTSKLMHWYLADRDPSARIKDWLVRSFEYNLWYVRERLLFPMERTRRV